jgi:hypothetical protein
MFKAQFLFCLTSLFVGSAAHATSICTAKDLFSGRTFTESGDTEAEAREAALQQCATKTGEVTCIVQCTDDDISGGAMPNGYYCIATDKTDRTWTALGSSLSEARKTSLQDCESEAGVSCRVKRCGMTT